MGLVSRRQVLRFGLSLLPFVLFRRSQASPSTIAEATLSLRILATSDLHCCLAPYDYYRDRSNSHIGLARLASLIAAARGEAPNTLLFDNGNLLQGNPLAEFIADARGLKPGEVHPAFKAMNMLRYDAATLGNHDFDYGLPFLERALAGAGFPYVCANVLQDVTGQPYFHPYVLLDRKFKDSTGQERRLRIGVFGVVTPQVAIWDRSRLAGKVTTADIVKTAADLVPKLRAAGADLVVALCHCGFGRAAPEDGAEDAAYAVSKLAGVDAVIAGHSGRVFPDISFAALPDFDLSRGTLNGKPAVMPGVYGNHLGVIDLTLSLSGDGKIEKTEGTVQTRALRDVSAETDSGIMQAIAAEHRAAIEYARQPIGRLDQTLTSYFAMVAPNPLLALIAEAQRWAVERWRAGQPELFGASAGLPLLVAVAPFKCGGRGGAGNYTAIEAGPVAICDIADFYPYPDQIEIVALDGAGLREWLEMSASAFHRIQAGHDRPQPLLERDRPSFDFDVMHGAEYRIDVIKAARYKPGGAMVDPAAFRIAGLSVGGKPVADGNRFLVATTSYRASGGGGFPGLDGAETIYRSPAQMQDVIVEYFRANPAIVIQGAVPWRFAALPQDATVVFESAPEAAQAIPPGSGIAFLETASDGFGRFTLTAV